MNEGEGVINRLSQDSNLENLTKKKKLCQPGTIRVSKLQLSGYIYSFEDNTF